MRCLIEKVLNSAGENQTQLASEASAVYFLRMIIEKAPQTVFTLLDDGSGVLLNLETRFYYSLNKTAVALWQELESRRTLTLEALIQATTTRFDVSYESASQEVNEFVSRLNEFKMVSLS